jgi:hypothetical protein
VKLDELRDALDGIAEPRHPDVFAARIAVRRRVRTTRRRWAVVATSLGVLAAVAGALVVRNDGPSPSVHTEPPASGSSHRACNQVPRPVPSADVPGDVLAWAGGRDVIGSGALWTARSATAVAPTPLDGGWYLKFPWVTRPHGLPEITGRRLDGPGTFHADVNDATDSRGTWVVSGLYFSTAGCWEVTARYAGSTLTMNLAAG